MRPVWLEQSEQETMVEEIREVSEGQISET